MKGLTKIIICFCFFVFPTLLIAQTKETTKNGTILHCWCWSFKTIEENIPAIAEAGFTALQTSPANTCLVGEYGGLDIFGQDLTGKWYYHYQPTDWKIGNYQLGTRDDFISMCKKAEEYGIAVIVDVLPNHTTPRLKEVSQDLIDAAGGMDNLYHENGMRDIRNWGNRYEATSGKMGGLPDVNTENPLFQAYFMNYMNDLIACGADGFRFDTAKHIALPDDPVDKASVENNFWPIFTGREDINGVMLQNAENLFMYGEVLQGDNSREADYAEFLPVTASSYGGILRQAVKSERLLAKTLQDWRNAAGGENLVTWIESHDTYANAGESAKMTHFQLRVGYAIIAARKNGTPLFFNRPQGKEATQFPGVSKIGDMGNDQFMHKEVKAVNKFRQAMVGEDEELINGPTNKIFAIKRGEKGIVIINMEDLSKKVSFSIDLPDGKYVDKANGRTYKVEDGVLSGRIYSNTIAVIY